MTIFTDRLMRDVFAGFAMIGLIVARPAEDYNREYEAEELTRESYSIADGFMKRRGKV